MNKKWYFYKDLKEARKDYKKLQEIFKKKIKEGDNWYGS